MKGVAMSVQLQSFRYLSQVTAIGGDKTTGLIQAAYAKATASVDGASSVAATEEVKERTLEDVKKEFYDFLDSLQTSAGLSKTPINVTVSDAAFERMLDDPEYMQRMKDLCRRDLCDPAWNTGSITPTYLHVNITDNTDNEFGSEYVCHSYNYDRGPNYEAETANSFWSKNTGKNDESKKIREKRREEKEMLELLLDRAQQRKEMLNSSWQSTFSYNNASFGYGDNGSGQSIAKNIGSLLHEA